MKHCLNAGMTAWLDKSHLYMLHFHSRCASLEAGQIRNAALLNCVCQILPRFVMLSAACKEHCPSGSLV